MIAFLHGALNFRIFPPVIVSYDGGQRGLAREWHGHEWRRAARGCGQSGKFAASPRFCRLDHRIADKCDRAHSSAARYSGHRRQNSSVCGEKWYGRCFQLSCHIQQCIQFHKRKAEHLSIEFRAPPREHRSSRTSI